MEMKRILTFSLAALVALVSCQEGSLLPEVDPAPAGVPIVFDLTADYGSATKAVKTAWEAGDVIFVFFEGVEAPRHLQMRYDGAAWATVEMNGGGGSLGAWKIKNFNEWMPGGRSALPTYDFNTAMSLGENIPSKEQWEKLISGLSWTPISVGRNITGLLGVDKDGKYIFLQDGCYWTSTLFPAEPEAVFVVFVDSRRRREPEIHVC